MSVHLLVYVCVCGCVCQCKCMCGCVCQCQCMCVCVCMSVLRMHGACVCYVCMVRVCGCVCVWERFTGQRWSPHTSFQSRVRQSFLSPNQHFCIFDQRLILSCVDKSLWGETGKLTSKLSLRFIFPDSAKIRIKNLIPNEKKLLDDEKTVYQLTNETPTTGKGIV